MGLVPSVICDREVDISDAVAMYAADLPSPEIAPEEFSDWKAFSMGMGPSDRPDSCRRALLACDPSRFPNVAVLLRIACTLAVTSCECERSNSVLRRLNNYMRSTMDQQRLSALALMHIHYSFSIDVNEVVDRFCRLHPRKMEVSANLISQ